MATLGERLRKEREAQGVTLDQISDATKIGSRYLKALEADDLDSLPGDVFTRGYVRAYAQHIGVDPAPMLDVHARQRGLDIVEADGQRQEQQVLIDLSKALGVRTRRQRIGPTRVRWLIAAGAISIAAVTAIVGLSLMSWGGRSSADDSNSSTASLAPGTALLAARADSDPGAGAEARQVETAAPPTRPKSGPAMPVPVETPAAKPAASAVSVVPEARREPFSAPGRTPGSQPSRQQSAATVPPSSARVAQTGSASTPESAAPPRVVDPGVEAHSSTMAAPAAPAAQLSIPDFAVGTGVANRQVVGAGDRFAEGTQVWFWTRVLGGENGETIRHVWIHEGRVITSADLRLGADHWRTQSRKTLYPGSAGNWTVEARDADGNVLAAQDFVCD